MERLEQLLYYSVASWYEGEGVVSTCLLNSFFQVSSIVGEPDPNDQGRWKKSLRELLRENFQFLTFLYCLKLLMRS